MKIYSREWKCSAKRLRFARAWKNSSVCDENLLVGMKMIRETLAFCETSRKILDIYVSTALLQVNPGCAGLPDGSSRYTCFAWAGGTCPRFAWAGGTFFQLCCCVSFWFWWEIGFGCTYYYVHGVPYSCGVVLVFLVLAGNSFWCHVRT